MNYKCVINHTWEKISIAKDTFFDFKLKRLAQVTTICLNITFKNTFMFTKVKYHLKIFSRLL